MRTNEYWNKRTENRLVQNERLSRVATVRVKKIYEEDGFKFNTKPLFDFYRKLKEDLTKYYEQ